MRLRYDRETRSLQFSVKRLADIGKFLLVKLIELNIVAWGGIYFGAVVIYDVGWVPGVLTFGFTLLLLLTYYPLKKLLRKYRRINLVELYLVILGSFFLIGFIEGQTNTYLQSLGEIGTSRWPSDAVRAVIFASAWVLVAAYYPFKKLLEFTWRRRQHFKHKRVALIGLSVLVLGMIPVFVILDPVGFRNNAIENNDIVKECGTPPLTLKQEVTESLETQGLQEKYSDYEYWVVYDADDQVIAEMQKFYTSQGGTHRVLEGCLDENVNRVLSPVRFGR